MNDPFKRISKSLAPRQLLAALEDIEVQRFLVIELCRQNVRPALFIRGVLELIKFSLRVLTRLNVDETETGLYKKLAANLPPDGLVTRIIGEFANLVESAQIQSDLIKLLEKRPRPAGPDMAGTLLSPELKVAINILSGVDELNLSIQDLRNTPQPLLGLRLNRKSARTGSIDANSLVYSRQLTDFIGRREDLSYLAEFLAAEDNVLWQVLTGSAGSGKSRLAQQFCLDFTDASWNPQAGDHLSWDVGFRADARLLANFPWGQWQPDSNKLIIFDDVSANATDMRKALLILHERRDLKYKVRFLLLERAVVSTWWDLLVPQGNSDGELVRDMIWQEPNEITQLSGLELHSILKETFKKADGNEGWFRANFHAIRRAARKMGALRQPLLAMMTGLHFAEISKKQGRVDGTSPRQLIGTILESEKHRWTEAGVPDATHRAIAMATLVGGLVRDDELAEDLDFATYQKAVPSLSGTGANPLTPDLLGELFVLEHIYSLRKIDAKKLMQMCWKRRPGQVRAFLERCIQDFSTHEALTQLLASPGDLDSGGFLGSDAAQQWFKLMFDSAEYAQDENKYRWALKTLFGALPKGFRPDEKLTARLIGRAPDYYAARRILEELDNLKFPLSTFHYNNLMRHAPAARVVNIVDRMRSRNIAPSEMTFGWVLRKSIGASLDVVLEDMSRAGLRPSSLVFNSALKTAEPRSVTAIVKRMMAMGVALSQETTNIVARKAPPKEALDLLCEIDQSPVHLHQSTFLIAARRGEGGYDRAQQILSHFRARGRKPSGELLAFVLDEAPTSAAQDGILQNLTTEGYRPDEVIYTILMDKADYAGAVRLFEQIRADGLETDAYIYSILIRKSPTDAEALIWHDSAVTDNVQLTPNYLAILCKRMNGAQAMAMLGKLDEAVLDAYVFGTIINKRDLSHEEKMILYERMKEIGIEPNQFVATHLLRAAPSQGVAGQIFADMVEYGVERNAAVYSLMISKAESWTDAEALALEYLKSAAPKTAEFLEALARKAPPNRAQEVLEDMRQHGFKPDQRLFGKVLNDSDDATALALFEHADDYGVELNREILNIVIKKLAAKNRQRAEALFEMMTKNGLGIDKYTIMPLLRGATPDEVARLLSAAHDFGVSIDPRMALVPLSQATTYDDARKVFAKLLSVGVKPEIAHYHVLTERGNLPQIKQCISEMRTLALTPDVQIEINYLRNCNFDEGDQFLKEREAQGNPSTNYHLQALFDHGDYEQKLEVLTRMGETHEPLGPAVYEGLIRTCGDFNGAVHHLRDLLERSAGELRVVGPMLSLIETTRQLARFVRTLAAANARISLEDLQKLRRRVRRTARGQTTQELLSLLDGITAEREGHTGEK